MDVPELVLASASRSRAELLRDAGYDPRVVRSGVDERALEAVGSPEPASVALRLARAKAAVAAQTLCDEPPRPTPSRARYDAVVVAADQLAVSADGAILHQAGSEERAVEQLMEMTAATYELVGAVVVLGVTGREVDAVASVVERHRITMRDYEVDDVVRYVTRYRPVDCAGAYRLEEDALPDAGLIASIETDDPTGIIGLPMMWLTPVLTRVGIMASASRRA